MRNNAKLRIGFSSVSSDEDIIPLSVHNVSANMWLSNNATWNNFGNGGVFDSSKYSTSNVAIGTVEWDITELVRKWYSYDLTQKLPNNGLLIKSDNEFFAVEKGFGRFSELIIDYIQDINPPTNPTVTSTNHKINQWNVDNTIDITVAGATDDLSGIDGFSTNWTQNSWGSVTFNKTLEENQTTFSSPPLGRGSWYLNLSTVDNVGNRSGNVLRVGPFKIGQTPVSIALKTKPKIVVPGEAVTIVGTIQGDNRPLASKVVNVRANGKLIKKIKSNVKGQFKFKHKPKKTTKYSASFAGNSQLTATSSSSAKVTVKKSKKKKKKK